MSPQVAPRTPADRAQGANANTWPRLNGDLILTPEDLLEGVGNLTDKNQDGQPEGLELVSVEQAEGRGVYIGTSPDATTKQTSLPIEQSSYLVNAPLVAGDPPPGAGEITAPLVTPGRPKVSLEPASVGGYPEATPESPHWIAFGWKLATGKHTSPGPGVSFTGGQGQCYRVTLPQEVPSFGVDGVDIWMAEPGTSSATRPGPMHIQATIPVVGYSAPTYDLLGPYQYDPQGPNDQVPTPKVPLLEHASPPGAVTLADTYRAITVTLVKRSAPVKGPNYDRNGFLDWFVRALSPATEPLEVAQEGDITVGGSRYPAASGSLRIHRSALPPNAFGWWALVHVESDGVWRRVGRVSGHVDTHGDALIPASTSYIDVADHDPSRPRQGSSFWGIFSEPRELEDELSGAGGAAPPDFAPEAPIAFGASRPAPDRYYVRTTEELGNLETLPSPPAEVDVGEADLIRIDFDNPKNRLPNATFREKDANGLPLGYAINQSGGSARLVSGELVLGTSGPQSGATPDALTPLVPVDPAEGWSVALRLKMENPSTGALSGSVEAVLRQIDAAGAATDTVLATLSAVGEREVRSRILAAGSTSVPGAFVWSAGTVSAGIFYRFAGATKNATMRISRQVLKGYSWHFRRRSYDVSPETAAATTDVSPETVVAPGTDVALEPPPPVPVPPVGEMVLTPDRPQGSGTVLESSAFEAGVPSDWDQQTSGGAIIDTHASAALAGSAGLRLRKTAGGASGRACIAKTFAPPAGLEERHDTGSLTSYRVASLSAGHYLDLHAIARPSDDELIAFLRYSNAFEVAHLTIDEPPTRPGNVSVNLDGTVTNVAVVATQEVASLAITAAPTSPGTVKITLEGVDTFVPVGGTAEEFRLQVNASPTTSGNVTITVDGVARSVRVRRGASPADIAAEIARLSWPGWRVRATGRNVTFTAVLAGPRTDATFSGGTTGMQATITVLAQGTIDTAEQLAARIRETRYKGWVTGGSGATVTFTAIQAGPKANLAYDPQGTGATGTPSTTTEGAVDTAGDLASRVRSAIDARSDFDASVSGSVVTITASAVGAKQNGSYDPGSTGAQGTFETLVEGSSGDVSVVVRDASGAEHRRKVFVDVGTGRFNVDTSVSGAGTKEAVIDFFGSLGTAPKTLIARFEYVDLTGFPAGRPRVGVVADSAPGATWEVHADALKVTDRGETYFEDHDYSGNLLNQGYYHGVPGQPVRGGVFFQGLRLAVVPGSQITFRAKARWDGVPSGAGTKPLSLTAVYAPGSGKQPTDLGDILGGEDGIEGTQGWHEPTALAPISVPEDCHEIWISSSAMSEGEVVVQQIVPTLGASVKRTPLYASEGSHRVTLDISTPKMAPGLLFWRARRLLLSRLESPEGTSAVLSYRSGDSVAGPWSDWESDPALVPDKSVLQANVEFASSAGGARTPVLKSGTPFAAYRLVLEGENLSTFLKGDFTELPGGAVFEAFREYSDLAEITLREKPGGDFDRKSLHAPVRRLPEFTLLTFTPEGMRYVEERWGLEDFGIEDAGEALVVKLKGPVLFGKTASRREIGDQVYAVYEAKVPAGSVVLATAPLA